MTLKERQDEFLDRLAETISTCTEDNAKLVGITRGVDEYLDTALQLIYNDIYIGMYDEFVANWSWSGDLDLASLDYTISVPVIIIKFSGVTGFSYSTSESETVDLYVGDLVEEYFSPCERERLFCGKKWVA